LTLAMNYLDMAIQTTESEEAVSHMQRKLGHLMQTYSDLQDHLSTH
jgi:hypothetical protein